MGGDETHECPTCGDTFASEHGVKVHQAKSSCGDTPWQDADRLRELYCDKLMSTHEIAERFDVGPGAVGHQLTKAGVELRDNSTSQQARSPKELHSEDWLREQYKTKQRPAYDIADELGVSGFTVYSWLDRHGIQVRRANATATDGNPLKLRDKDWLRTEYVEKEKSTLKIAEQLGVSHQTVLYWMDKHGIDRRNGHRAEQHYKWKGGVDNYYGPNWHEKRRQVRDRDQHRCQSCGMSEAEHLERFGRKNPVHHITPLREFESDDGVDYEEANATSNLITLCDDCHPKADRMAPLLPDGVGSPAD